MNNEGPSGHPGETDLRIAAGCLRRLLMIPAILTDATVATVRFPPLRVGRPDYAVALAISAGVSREKDFPVFSESQLWTSGA